MNIEDSIKTLKEFNKIKINSYAMQFVNISYPELQEAIDTLLTAYEKEKEKNEKDIKFKRILADDFKKHIESITIGESITFPCGWVYKKDLLDLINDVKWEE